MLEVQKYLQANSLEKLQEELHIDCTFHPEDTRVILNYCQIDSPKTNPIVRNCRGLILDQKDWSIVAKGFYRFYNWGEVQEEAKEFDFSNFHVQSKEDGSYINLYYYNGSWHVSTRASFANGSINNAINYSWKQVFEIALGLKDINNIKGLDANVNYVFELTSPYNKVVRYYNEPKAYLLSAFRQEEELSIAYCDEIAERIGCKRPILYSFTSIDEIRNFLDKMGNDDPSFEGVIIRDANNNRWKIKNETYMALHAMFNNGNLFRPKYLLPFIFKNESDELLVYFPEVKDVYFEVKEIVDSHYFTLEKTWEQYWQIENQKEFALAIKGVKFGWMLFELRKNHGQNQTKELLTQMWRQQDLPSLNRSLFKKFISKYVIPIDLVEEDDER